MLDTIAKRTKILSILMLLFFLSLMLAPVGALAQAPEGTGPPEGVGPPELDTKGKKVTLSTGNFSLEVNAGGEVPYYHFNSTQGKFFLKFQKIIEFKDNNSNGYYDQGEMVGQSLTLTGVNWELIIDTDTDTAKEFTFQSEQITKPGYSGTEIKLVNHFTGTDPSLKFDVIINNWPFSEESTGLSLEFQLIAQSEDDTDLEVEVVSDETSIILQSLDGDILAFFNSVSDIVVDGEAVSGGASLHDVSEPEEEESKLRVYINYPRFDTSLVHDPEFGTTWDATGMIPLGQATTFFFQLLEGTVKAGLAGITAVVTLLFGTVLVYSRRKR